MTFASLLPLIMLVGVPVIIILYLMKPKGTRKVVPSLLLWKNAERNDQSMTFSKKLINNILMILEILTLIFLVLAAMSPAIKRGMTGSTKSTILVIDTSGSMQFQNEDGKTRLEEAILDAKDFVETSSGDISIITCDSNIEVLANGSKDKQKLKRLLSGIAASDTAGDISKASGIIESLEKEDIIVFTDGNGAAGLEEMAAGMSMDIKVYGEAVQNVGLTQMSMKKNDSGHYDVAIGYQNKGEESRNFDISLYDSDDKLIDVRSVEVEGNQFGTVLMMDRAVEGDFVKAEISGLSEDGLLRDNTAFAVKTDTTEKPMYLVGVGNTYFEKAYTAVTADTVIKVTSDSDITEAGAVAIYDRADLQNKNLPRLVQGYKPEGAETIPGAIVTVRTGNLIADMTDYTFGASNLSVLECPDWAEPLMIVKDSNGEEKIIAYYGEENGVRQVVLGFDIRDSEYPLLAEFPIFVADSITYLTDESLVQSKYIQAGEMLDLSPSVSSAMKLETVDNGSFSGKAKAKEGGSADTNHSGLCKLTDTDANNQIKEEYFVVRYPGTEADGTVETESMSYITDAEYGVRFGSIKRVCLVIALLILILDWIIFIRRRVRVRKPELIWRIALTLMILLSVIGIHLPGRKNKMTTIFVVDMSDSNIASLSEEESYLRSTISKMPKGDSFGIVTFGRSATTEQFVSDEAEYLGIATNPDGSATDIEGAVEYAISLIPDSRLGRVVILSDGKETVGDIGKTADKLKENDVEICAMLYEMEQSQDVYLQNVDMPDKMAAGDAYNIKATVYSTYECDASLKLFNGSEVIDQMDVHLTKGENTFIMKEVAGDEAIEERHLEVEAQGDTVIENNSMVVAALVEAPQKILIVSGLSEDSSGLEHMMGSLNKDTTVVSAVNAPDNISGLLKYKTIILDDCYISDLPEGFLNAIQSYVKDYGGGLICTGGKESYAPGGYTDTVLEEVLPVDMMPKGVEEAPSLAMVMVIDCSGSMDSAGYDPNTGQTVGRSKIDVAVDAAIEAVKNLNRNDYVGVVTFSDNYEWRQKIVPAEDKDAIIEQIEGIGIMGGTVIKPAVDAAAKGVSGVDAGVKHILLLTDGEGETKDFDDVIEYINDNGITMSTIAVGSDSDTKLLEELAEDCGGRYYYSDSSSDVPKIFAEEVYLSGTTYYKNGDFALSLKNNELVSGLYSEGIPNITGYIAATTKSGAREVITTSEDDPLMSAWQYGLGHSIAWTTNASGEWNAALAQQDDYLEMWNKMLSYACMQSDIGQDSVSVTKRRGKVEINYVASDYSEDTEVIGVYTSPTGETEELVLEPGDPGCYTASFQPTEMGVYSINIRRNEGEETVASTTAIETVQFSDEYRRDISNANFKAFIETNGRMLDSDSKVFTKLRASNRNRRDITTILIILSVIMLIIDIVIRRFDLGRILFNRAGRGASDRAVKDNAVKKAGKRRSRKAGEPDSAGVIASVPGTDTMPSGQYGQPGAQRSTGMQVSAGINGQINGQPEIQTGIDQKKGKIKKNKKDKGEEPAPAGLDTTTLLQKKKNRNL